MMRDYKPKGVKYPIFLLILAYVGLHTMLVLSASQFDLREALTRLTYLDSQWYLDLAQHGYAPHNTGEVLGDNSSAQYAFLPLWPLILRGVAFFASDIYQAAFGSLLSLAFLLIAVSASLHHANNSNQPGHINPLYPTSAIGVAFLLFSPGAWVFLSNHTESLFLFLSFFAFYFASRKRFILATILSGLATLTRNQGILVAITVGLFAVEDDKIPLKKRAIRFVWIGLGSGCFYSSWLYFLYLQTGDIFASSRAQRNWRITSSWAEYLSNLTWLSPTNASRAALFWAVTATGLWIMTKGRKKYEHALPLGFYLLTSALLWPLQGNNFPQAYRFGAVLFPFWNILGLKANTLLAAIRQKMRIPVTMTLIALLMTIAGTVSSYFYFQSRNHWPY